MSSYTRLQRLRGANNTPRLTIAGATTVEAGSSATLALSVLHNPAINPYNGFAEVSDPDNIASLSSSTITLTTTSDLGAHALTYKATSSGGRPDLPLAFTVTVVDTTAPVLSLPTGTQTGATTATLGVTTNEGSAPDGINGTLYAVASTSATPPTSAQIIAGHDSTGGAAAYTANQAVSSTGAKTFSATGLVTVTTYYAYFVQKDSAGNVSNVAASTSFTTVSSSDTFNPADIVGGTLSNGNRTFVQTTGDAYARSNNSHSSGKYHIEFTADVTGAEHMVFAFSPAANSGAPGFADKGSVTALMSLSGNGSHVFNGVGGNWSDQGDNAKWAWNNGDVLVVELDLDGLTVRAQNFTQASGWPVSPSATLSLAGATNLPWFFEFWCRQAGGQITVNAGQSAYAVTPTAGYGNW